MKRLTQLRKEHAIQLYGVPKAMTNEIRNTFWGDSIHEDGTPITYDMPRSLIASIPISDYETQLYIQTIDAELFDAMEGKYNSFDAQVGKYLHLDLDQFTELIQILRIFANSLLPLSTVATDLAEINYNDLQKRNVQPWRPENSEQLYLLLSQNNVQSEVNDSLIILTISKQPQKKIGIEILNLPQKTDKLLNDFELESLETNKILLNQQTLFQLVNQLEKVAKSIQA